MNKMKLCLKKFLSRWNTFEKCYYVLSCIILIALSVVFGSDILPLVVSLFGITAVVMNTKAYGLCFFFFVFMAGLYGYVAFTQKFYGEAVLNICYLLPTYLLSFFGWLKKRTNYVTVEIYTVTNKILIIMLIAGMIGVPLYGFVLSLTETSFPYLNAIGTYVCCCAAYLTSRKMKEQWIFWILNCSVLIILWCTNLNGGLSNLPILIQNLLFAVIDIYGYRNWKRMQKYLNEEKDTLG